jgi:hypothetical protein
VNWPAHGEKWLMMLSICIPIFSTDTLREGILTVIRSIFSSRYRNSFKNDTEITEYHMTLYDTYCQLSGKRGKQKVWTKAARNYPIECRLNMVDGCIESS